MMKKKIASAIILTLLLIGMLTLTFDIQRVKADWTWTETIYIRADGSIEPDTAPISTADNVTYTLTDNIAGYVPAMTDAITVERNNIVIDGAGYTLQGTGTEGSLGINLTERSNVTIKNLKIKAFSFGILLDECSNNTISGNTITDNWDGIIGLFCTNNTVANNEISNIYLGIVLGIYCNNNLVANNIASKMPDCIAIEFAGSCCNNQIVNNTAQEVSSGIYIQDSCSRNTVTGNFVSYAHSGIYLYDHCTDNILTENTLSNNWQRGGILVNELCSNNTIAANTLSNNTYGIKLDGSDGNIIRHNNFINNTLQAYSIDSENVWDNGYPSGGNYWSDHVTVDDYSGINQDELGSDGIVDEPYIIDDDNEDNYPLTEPWTPLPRTIDELKTEIEECWLEGEIDNRGIVKSLIAKLNVAQKLVDKGKIEEAKSILEDDFILQVQNLTEIHITLEAADILIQSAEYILSHL